MFNRLQDRQRDTDPKQRRRPRRQFHMETLERRDLLTALAWSNGPDLPDARTDAVAVVTSDNAIRLLGGESASATTAPILAAGGTSWSLGFGIDTQRNDLGAVRAGSSVYLFGGTGNNEGSDEVLNYDYRFGDSQDLAKMSTIRYDLGYAVDAAGRAYALGGIGVYDDGEIWADAERYDPGSDTWSAIASLPEALHGMSAIGDGNGHIFVFGGSTTLDDAGIQRTSYSYDVATDTWSTVAPMPTGTRDSATVMDDDGSVYVLGGMTTSGATGAVQVYDPATNTWTMQTSLPAPVYSHAAAFGPGGKMLVAGGFDAADNPTNAVYATQDLTVPDIAPVISTSAVTDASLDAFYTYDVDASGNPEPTYSLAAAPNGMTIDSATGLISWQPVDGQVGTHSVLVQASNRAGSADQPFDITVVADTIAPTVPTNFALQGATTTSLTFQWTASTDAVGVDHYEVATTVYTGPRFAKRWVYTVVDSVPGTSTTGTVTGLAPLEGHNYAIRAVDTTGLVSSWSPRIFVSTLSAPTLTFQYGTQTSGSVQSPAKTPIQLQLRSTANPAAEFSLVSGPAGVVVDPITGIVQWTPAVADIGLHDAIFRATNSVASTDLTISFDILPDAPQLSVQFDPATGGTALAGTPFTAQINDASSTASTYELTTFPLGMTISDATGLIAWTPTGDQGGTQSVTVRGSNAGGVTDLTFNIQTQFTGAVSGVSVTGTSLAEPTAHWIAPVGEGSDLVSSYQIHGFAEWGVGRTYTTHTVDYSVPATESSVLLTGLVTGKSYRLTITPLDAAGNHGLANNETTFVSSPALPQVRWTVNGFSGGSSVPGEVIAGQPAEVVLTDQQAEASAIILISGPDGLTFNPTTGIANWTPTAGQVTSGYATTAATFQATNSVGTVDVVVPIRVYFSGTVRNATTTKYGDTATASWDPPTNNIAPIAGYSITRYWHWQSHRYSTTWTVAPTDTNITIALVPTGTAVHDGISIAPIDALGNLGVSTGRINYGERQNDLPPIAVDDAYAATEDTTLTVAFTDGVRANDIDTDNTPLINPLTAQLVTGPSNGTLTLDAAGSFTYAPNGDFHGTDTFTYRVYDGKYYSDNATVTITVDPVNDTPTAVDDYFFVARDTPLTVDTVNGVVANDSDVDGDVLTVSLLDGPANGTASLNADGSFTYTPSAGFSGIDAFTYVATDSLLDSRVAIVSIEVTLPLTKFFVVDTAVERQFEYAADGTLVEDYSLRSNNKGSQGVTSNTDGSTVWVINGNKRVFVYDNTGGYLGFWTAVGPSRVDGIATDGVDIWVLDRKLDTVFRYADAAATRSGELTATDSFVLHTNNKNGKGITTDGASIWVVNDVSGNDKVYQYDIEGNYLGRWNIDPANSKPTGITIDPTGASDAVWVVDNLSDSVYQYDAGATRTAGSVVADTVFALAPTNTNPQGIADPLAIAGEFTPTMIPSAPLPEIFSPQPDGRIAREDGVSPRGLGRDTVFAEFGSSEERLHEPLDHVNEITRSRFALRSREALLGRTSRWSKDLSSDDPATLADDELLASDDHERFDTLFEMLGRSKRQ